MSKQEVQKTLSRMAKQNIAMDSEYALAWLALNMSKIESKMSQADFLRSKSTENEKAFTTPIIRGRMFFFGYLPKTKNDLSFWDEFPIVLVLSRGTKSMLGLNFHYLNPVERVTLLGRLLYFVQDENWIKNNNKKALIDIRYDQLKNKAGLSFYKKCIKRYYFSNIMTKMLYISPMEWKAVPFFPLDKFRGMGKTQIWRLGMGGKTNNR